MKPDLDAIRARWPDGRLANTDAREDVLALLACVEELERDLLHERATFESCNRARQHCEHECATLKARTTYTVGETELAQRIAVAEQRFVDEYDARKAAERERDEALARLPVDGSNMPSIVDALEDDNAALRAEIAELKARITTLEVMR